MLYGKNQESVLTEIIPRICTLATQGQHPVLSHPSSLKYMGMGLMA